MKIKTNFLLFCIIFLAGFLRFYNISLNPPGLYTDEISIGLNAYDVLKTGKDQYGTSYPLTFRSFGDYKMPVYIYSVAGAMAIFGKTDFAVRFPSALAGTLTVLVIYFLFRELLKESRTTKKNADIFALVATSIYAILPWHIQFSRGGFETCLALLFYITSLFLWVYYRKAGNKWFLVGTIAFLILSEYTYHSYRIIAPLTAFFALAFSIKEKKHFKQIAMAFIIFLFFSIPIIVFSFTIAGQARLLATSAFYQNTFPKGIVSIIADIIIFINNYLSYFSITYLFHYGDGINRHQVQNFGLLYLWQLPFCLIGIYFLSRMKSSLVRYLTCFLFIIGPIAPSISLPTPHTLRFLLGSVPFVFITTLGIYQIYLLKSKWSKLTIQITLIISVIFFGYFLDYYFIQYPKEAQVDWGGACKQIAYEIQVNKAKFNYIVIDKNLGCIPQYFSFYIPSILIQYAGPSWKEPDMWKIGEVLYVRPYYGNPNPKKLIQNIYLSNVNHDIFAQIYKI